MKSWVAIIITVAIVCLTVLLIFVEVLGSISCPYDGLVAYWNGVVKQTAALEGVRVFKLYECAQGHRFWVRID